MGALPRACAARSIRAPTSRRGDAYAGAREGVQGVHPQSVGADASTGPVRRYPSTERLSRCPACRTTPTCRPRTRAAARDAARDAGRHASPAGDDAAAARRRRDACSAAKPPSKAHPRRSRSQRRTPRRPSRRPRRQRQRPQRRQRRRRSLRPRPSRPRRRRRRPRRRRCRALSRRRVSQRRRSATCPISSRRPRA